jgi:hypothetical protein
LVATGVGELGKCVQVRFFGEDRAVIERGADPYDPQALYNTDSAARQKRAGARHFPWPGHRQL